MFTGIIEEIGTIGSVARVGGGIRLTVVAAKSAPDLCVNDSIAINGVCQTVITKSGDRFTVEGVEETLKKTTLGGLTARTAVNLELALRLNDRLGGHLVLGHVDGVGIVKSIEKKETSWLFAIEIPQQFLKYVIPVGSIAIDGVSLTVARIEGNVVTVSIIPHTFENTTFQYFSTGSKVNLEFDLIGKYIERLVGKDAPDQITANKLRMWGYSE